MTDLVPRYRKQRVRGGYLVWSQTGTRLFMLTRYEEDGSLSKPQFNGTDRIIRGTCWHIQVLVEDFGSDGSFMEWPVIQRAADGRITGVDPDVVDYGQWTSLSNGHETLRSAQQYVLDQGDLDWIDEMVKTSRRRRAGL